MAKETAVEAEDYDAAKRLKAAQQELQALGGQLANLEVCKRRAVRDENYDRAKLLKHEISALRRHIDTALQQHAITASASEHHTVTVPIAPARIEERQKPNTPSLPLDEFSSAPPGPIHGQVPSLQESSASLHESSCRAGPGSVILESPTELPLDSDSKADKEFHMSSTSGLSILPPNQRQNSASPPGLQVKTLQTKDQDEPGDSLCGRHTLGCIPGVQRSEISSPTDAAFSVDAAQPSALEGVPNSIELPAPEPFQADMGSDIDVASISALFGDYLARCLFSKNWTLREAALAKARLLVDAGNWEQIEDLERLCDVARIGVHDKIAQVYLTSLALLDDAAHKLAACGFKRADAFPVLEPAIAAVVAKLGDNQPRLREKAVDALTSLAHCRVVGADRVAEKVMRSLERRCPPHKNKWRPIATRLEFLKRLALDFGVGNRDAVKKSPHTLNLEAIVAFVEAHGCASHTFEEVRVAAKELIVVVFVTASTSDRTRLLDPFLDKLRPKQAQEYRVAIERSVNERHRHLNPSDQTYAKAQLQETLHAGPYKVAQPGEAGPAPAQPLESELYPFQPFTAAPSPPNVTDSSPRPKFRGDGDDEQNSCVSCDTLHLQINAFTCRSQRSDDPEEERFRDQIMKQLEEKAFSVNAGVLHFAHDSA